MRWKSCSEFFRKPGHTGTIPGIPGLQDTRRQTASFHCIGEELKGQQGRRLPQQEGQPGSASDLPCDLEQVLSMTSSAHSQADV